MNGSIGAASGYSSAHDQAEDPVIARFDRWRLASKLEFGPLPSAIPCARLHAKHICKEWNLAHITDDAELIVSELMTNAIKAAGPHRDIQPVTLYLLASHEHLLIQVWDALTAVPAPRPHAIDAETGRGLEIVSLLSDRWGYYHLDGGGKVVWAVLATGAVTASRHLPATIAAGLAGGGAVEQGSGPEEPGQRDAGAPRNGDNGVAPDGGGAEQQAPEGLDDGRERLVLGEPAHPAGIEAARQGWLSEPADVPAARAGHPGRLRPDLAPAGAPWQNGP